MTELGNSRSFFVRRRVDLIIGLVLLVIALMVVIPTLNYVFHTNSARARTLGLPLPVQTLQTRVTQLDESIGASGSIQPSIPVSVVAKVVGKVASVPVDLGVVVHAGDLLAQIDDRLFRANLEAAEANHDHARKQLHRMESLYKQNFASLADVETARTDEKVTQQAVVQAQIDLENTRIVSPAPAVVINRGVNPGEMTKVDTEMFKLGVIDPVLMAGEVSEDKIGFVYLGMHGKIGTDAYPGVTFEGTVTKIDAQVSDTTRTFTVFLQIANRDLRLKPGVTGYVRLESKRMALAIPSTALLNPIADHASVFVVGVDGRAHLREVHRGLTINGLTELLSGVQEGEEIVTAGQLDLRDNDKVNANRYGPWNQQ